MSDHGTLLSAPPGEPANAANGDDYVAPPAQVADLDAPTGTDIDGVSADPGMSDDAMRDALAKIMRGEDVEIDGIELDNTDAAAPVVHAQPDSSVGAPNEPEISPTTTTTATVPDPGEGGDGTPSQPLPPATDAGSGVTDPRLAQGWVDLGGGVVVPPEVADVVRFVGELNPLQTQAINDLLSGQYHLVPANPAASGSGPVPPGAPAPGGYGQPGQPTTPSPYAPAQPAIDPTLTPPVINPDDFSDPDLARAVLATQQQTQAQLAALIQSQELDRARQAELLQYQAQQQQQTMREAGDKAIADYATSKNLDPESRDRLITAATQLQIGDRVHRKHNGNTYAAMTEILDTAYWTTPEFRDRAIQDQIAGFTAGAQVTNERKAKAAAVSGGGSAVPRVAPAANVGAMSKDQRQKAMVEELRGVMENS